MFKFHHFIAPLLSLALLLPAAVTHAEIYKWVDKDGNVHFGDKPRDESKATEAEKVDLQQSYTPPDRSAQELEAIKQEQQTDRERRREDEREENARLDEERAEKARKKTELCAFYDSELKKFTGYRMVNGRLTMYYLADEEGKSLSAAEQREKVAQMKAQAAEAGCPGQGEGE